MSIRGGDILVRFGFIKNHVMLKTKRSGLYGAGLTFLVGAIASGTSYGIVYAIDRSQIHT